MTKEILSMFLKLNRKSFLSRKPFSSAKKHLENQGKSRTIQSVNVLLNLFSSILVTSNNLLSEQN